MSIENYFQGILDYVDKVYENPRLTAVLFFDFVGSTEYKSRRELASSLFKIFIHNSEIEKQIIKHKGNVIKSLGDGVLATFIINKPQDIETPLKAASYALGALKKHNIGLSTSESIMSRVGITCGKVIDYNAVNPKGESISDPQGSIVDLSSRLCSLASANQILCCSNVYQLTRKSGSRFRFSSPEKRLLKGFDSPSEIFAFKWAKEANMKIPNSKPLYIDQGFLTNEFVLNCVKKSVNNVSITGLTHRLYCENVDLYNLILEKSKQNKNYKIEFIMLNPKSSFRSYASLISRRNIKNFYPAVTKNIEKFCKCFMALEKHIRIIVVDYPLMIPFVHVDNFIYFSLPYISFETGIGKEGIVGGGYFCIEDDSKIGQKIFRNYDKDTKIIIDMKKIASRKLKLNKLFN